MAYGKDNRLCRGSRAAPQCCTYSFGIACLSLVSGRWEALQQAAVASHVFIPVTCTARRLNQRSSKHVRDEMRNASAFGCHLALSDVQARAVRDPRCDVVFSCVVHASSEWASIAVYKRHDALR